MFSHRLELVVVFILVACGPRAPQPAAATIATAPTHEVRAMPIVLRVALVQGEVVPFPSTSLTATLMSSKVVLYNDGGVRRETSHANLVLADGDDRVAITVEVGAFDALGRQWMLHGEAGALELSLVPEGVHVKQ